MIIHFGNSKYCLSFAVFAFPFCFCHAVSSFVPWAREFRWLIQRLLHLLHVLIARPSDGIKWTDSTGVVIVNGGEKKPLFPEEARPVAIHLGTSLLLLPESFQEQPHWCAFESDALDFVLNLIFDIPETHGSMAKDHYCGWRKNEV